MLRQRRVHSLQLLVVCILASTTFGLGFLVAVRPDARAPPTAPRVSPPQHQQAALPSVAPSAPADSAALGVDSVSQAAEDAAENVDEAVLRTATFTKILPFPFEQVLTHWENGPPDPNFIREDAVLQVHGAEEHRSKTLYTKNPLPWILRKTVRLPCLHPSACMSSARASVPAAALPCLRWRESVKSAAPLSDAIKRCH